MLNTPRGKLGIAYAVILISILLLIRLHFFYDYYTENDFLYLPCRFWWSLESILLAFVVIVFNGAKNDTRKWKQILIPYLITYPIYIVVISCLLFAFANSNDELKNNLYYPFSFGMGIFLGRLTDKIINNLSSWIEKMTDKIT